MKYLLIMLLSISLSCQGQTTKVSVTNPPSEKVLIADETWIVASGKSGFRLIISNDFIAKQVLTKFEGKGITKFTYTQKKDRNGYYWERSYYFKNESWNLVTLFVKNGFR